MRIFLSLFFIFCASFANPVVNELNAQNKASKEHTKQIQAIDDKTQEALNQYKELSKELSSLKRYNQDLQKLKLAQEQELNTLEKSIKNIEVQKRGVYPLFEKMLNAFEDLVLNDVPFLQEERQERLKRLKALNSRADISVTQKFRSLFEAYLIENEYSNTIKTYDGILDSKNATFLQVGRIGFWAIVDNKPFIWDKKSKKWQSSSHLANLKHAIKIAQKSSVPDLLILPIIKDLR